MLTVIKRWIEEFYRNGYTFDHQTFYEIMEGMTDELVSLTDDELHFVNKILKRIMDQYEKKDYFYTVEIFEFEFAPLFISD